MPKILNRFSIFLFLLVALLGSTAFGYDVYIPHISGTGGFWKDTLLVNNNNPEQASFTITLYDGGDQVYEGSFSVNGLGNKRIDLKSLASDIAQGTGVVNYDSEHLYFRLSHESKAGGGAAEFRLTGDKHPVLGFFFSEYTPEVAWKAIAFANMNPAAADVRLYALTEKGIQYCKDITIAPFSKTVGLYGAWFPFLAMKSITKIFAVSSQDLCGVTISGNAAESFLLFTAAADAPIPNPLSSLICPDDTDDDGDGYTEKDGDCNDVNPNIHREATEIECDGIDQDCNGRDECDEDKDRDGYSVSEDDCNDADASIHPGATEICGDRIDQDCIGGDLACEPPILDYISDKMVKEGQLIEFTIHATDPNGDSLSYSCSNLPLGASFNSSSGFFHWLTDSEDSGSYQIIFTAKNNRIPTLSDSQAVFITVENNNPPVFYTSGGDIYNSAGDYVAFSGLLRGYDPDLYDSYHTYFVGALPPGVTDLDSQVCYWTCEEPGSWSVELYIVDEWGLQDSQIVNFYCFE